MHYLDLNYKQKYYIYNTCKVNHVKDIGGKTELYKRLCKLDGINTFITDFKESKSGKHFKWEYDVIYVPFNQAYKINMLLNLPNDDIISSRFR